MFKNILIPIHLEYKKNHKKLLTGALEVLSKEEGKMVMLNVEENSAHSGVSPLFDEKNERDYEQSALSQLQEIAQNYKLPMDRLSFVINHGAVHQEILQEAHRMNADAIVMMATKPGLGSYFISSTAERVMRHAKCSVFVIRLSDDEHR
ncbi:MAG: universal stress protein [Sulfurospirillaceae bacterium]|nr:universal stress protein [Sulfurospirillaceae bacterium]